MERVIRTKHDLLKKPVFLAGIADWLSELQSVCKNYNNKIYNSRKFTPVQASKRVIEKTAYSKLQDKRKELRAKDNLEQLVCTADIKSVCSRGDSTNWSFKNHLHLMKPYMIQFLLTEPTIYQKVIMKIKINQN